MSDDIIVSDVKTGAQETVLIAEASPQGWIAFYRAQHGAWGVAWPVAGEGYDAYRNPGPLFPTREAALVGARRNLPSGGEARIVEVRGTGEAR